MPSPSDSSVSCTTRVYSPGVAVTVKEYGDRVQHSAAVVKPFRTTSSPRFSSQTTLASKVAAWPVTSNRVGTDSPSPGVAIETAARVESSLARCNGAEVSMP